MMIPWGLKRIGIFYVRYCNINSQAAALCFLLVECCELELKIIRMVERGMDSSGTEERQVAGCCE
jgi:hypothetical protein